MKRSQHHLRWADRFGGASGAANANQAAPLRRHSQVANPLAETFESGKPAALRKKSMASIKDKVRTLTRRAKHRTLADLLRRLNPVLRGWCNYFRHGVCKRTFGYVDHFAFWRIVGWLTKRHLGLNMHTLVRRYLPGWEIGDGGIEMFRPRAVAIERYRYRGTKIPTPWTSETTGPHAPAA